MAFGARSHDRVRTPISVAARFVVAIVVGLWLAWHIIAAGLSSMAVETSDGRLLSIMGGPSHPDAGAMLAEAALLGGERGAAMQIADAVVRVDPVNVIALRVLGLATIAAGNHRRGNAIMRQAGALGWQDTSTQLWVLRDAILRGDYTAAIQRADALARRNQSGDVTNVIFLAAIVDPKLRGVLADRLGNDPMWRGAFFASVRQFLTKESIRPMEALFADMRARGETIAPVEWLSYVDRLVDLGQFQHAHDVWAKAFGIPRSAVAAVPFDSDFKNVAARAADAPASQFEWALNPDQADSLIGNGTGTGLSVTPGVMGGTVLASQFLTLSPGPHILTAQVDAHAPPAAATWTFTCLPSKSDLPKERTDATDDEASSVTVDVPPEGCVAQRLSLVSIDQPSGKPVTISSVHIR